MVDHSVLVFRTMAMAKMSSLLEKKSARHVAALATSSKQMVEKVRIANLVVSRIAARKTKARMERMRKSVFLAREEVRLRGEKGSEDEVAERASNEKAQGKPKFKGQSPATKDKYKDDIEDPFVDVTYPARLRFCICARPAENGTFMMQCSNKHCGGWFHPICLGIADQIAKQSIETFTCVFCEVAYPNGTIGHTSFAANADICALTENSAMVTKRTGKTSSYSPSKLPVQNIEGAKKKNSRKRKRQTAGDLVASAVIHDVKRYEKAKQKALKVVQHFRDVIKMEERKAKELQKVENKRRKEDERKQKREEDNKALRLLTKSRRLPDRQRKASASGERSVAMEKSGIQGGV